MYHAYNTQSIHSTSAKAWKNVSNVFSCIVNHTPRFVWAHAIVQWHSHAHAPWHVCLDKQHESYQCYLANRLHFINYSIQTRLTCETLNIALGLAFEIWPKSCQAGSGPGHEKYTAPPIPSGNGTFPSKNTTTCWTLSGSAKWKTNWFSVTCWDSVRTLKSYTKQSVLLTCLPLIQSINYRLSHMWFNLWYKSHMCRLSFCGTIGLYMFYIILNRTIHGCLENKRNLFLVLNRIYISLVRFAHLWDILVNIRTSMYYSPCIISIYYYLRTDQKPDNQTLYARAIRSLAKYWAKNHKKTSDFQNSGITIKNS